MAETLAQDWRTRPAARETTVVTVGVGGKPALTVVLAVDGTVRIEHHLPETATVRVSRDGPGGYRTESRQAAPWTAVTLLSEEETGA